MVQQHDRDVNDAPVTETGNGKSRSGSMSIGDEAVDPKELGRFESLSASWWGDARGMQALRDITPARVGYIASRARLEGSRVLDVGCGGGILSEALARRGAIVTGIDPGEGAVRAARQHSSGSGLSLDYRVASAESFARQHPGCFDIVVCMELLEHVPRPGEVVLACTEAVRPGGEVFFATINRNGLAVFLAVYVAEWCLGVVARGTHDWSCFVRPRELAAWAGQSGLEIVEAKGLFYLPLIRYARLVPCTAVNYMLHCRRPKQPEGTIQGLADGENKAKANHEKMD